MKITIADLSGKEIADFLEEHIKEMRGISPPESKHALDLEGLRTPEVTFWTVWDNETLVGCGALMELNAQHAEIKSMRVSPLARGKGIASMLLQHMFIEASKQGYSRLSLETGSIPYFEPARKLYSKYSFKYCAPFANYKEDPNSVFLTKVLGRCHMTSTGSGITP
jgi:putative acetyltransferase